MGFSTGRTTGFSGFAGIGFMMGRVGLVGLAGFVGIGFMIGRTGFGVKGMGFMMGRPGVPVFGLFGLVFGVFGAGTFRIGRREILLMGGPLGVV
jgi:hypothetical protein